MNMARSMFCMLFMSLLILGSAVENRNYPKPDGEEKEEPRSEDLENEDLSYYMNNGEQAPKPKPDENPKVDYYNYNRGNESIGVQGVILCKSNQKSFPLVGAVVKITCVSEYENGYEGAPFYIESHKSDEKGFFFATFSLSDSMVRSSDDSKLKECKVFLDDSPTQSCETPTDVNSGISGAILSSPHSIPEKNMLLYTVGPFFYTSDRSYSSPTKGDHY